MKRLVVVLVGLALLAGGCKKDRDTNKAPPGTDFRPGKPPGPPPLPLPPQ